MFGLQSCLINGETSPEEHQKNLELRLVQKVLAAHHL